MALETTHWNTNDNLFISGYNWPIKKPKAVICLVHGWGEHGRRYDHVAAYYNEKGYALLTCDLRGHGKSEGKRGHTPGYDQLLEDVSTFLEQADALYPKTKKVLYGHSMGGGIVLNFLLKKKSDIVAAVATSPFIEAGFKPPALLVFLGKLMKNIKPDFTQSTEISAEGLSHDEEYVATYMDDELVHNKLSSALGMGMVESGEWLLKQSGTMPVPTLLQHGTGDTITSHDASVRFSKGISKNLELKLWDDLFHEMHNEIEKEKFFDSTIKWIDKQIG